MKPCLSMEKQGFFSTKIIKSNKGRERRNRWGKKVKNVLTSGQRCGTIVVGYGMNCNINKSTANHVCKIISKTKGGIDLYLNDRNIYYKFIEDAIK